MTELTDILSKPPKRYECTFANWIDSLSEEEQVSVKKAVLNPEWSNLALTNTLKQHGMPCDRRTVTAHRNGECKHCGPV
jgi:glutaminase